MNEQQAAAALFPTMAGKTEARPQAAPSDHERLAAQLYPVATPARAKPGASEAERMFPTMAGKTEAKANIKPTAEELQAAKMFPSMAKPGDQQQQEQRQPQDEQQSQQQSEAAAISAGLAEIFEDLDIEHPIIQQFANLAADLNLDADGAAQLMEMHENTTHAENAQTALAWQQAWEARPNAEADLEVANHLLRAYGSDALRAFLRDSAVGRHPELIEFISKVGNVMGYKSPKWR